MSDWESLRVALVTLLSILVFGLGWTSLELERVMGVDSATNAKLYEGRPDIASIADERDSQPAEIAPTAPDGSAGAETGVGATAD